MTPEQQQIAIAEACGWTHVFKGENTQRIYGYPPKPTGKGLGDALVPDYLNDLNAMHEAEKVIKNTELWRHYKYELDRMPIDCIHATATQRAEAFLRTLNLWKE